MEGSESGKVLDLEEEDPFNTLDGDGDSRIGLRIVTSPRAEGERGDEEIVRGFFKILSP